MSDLYLRSGIFLAPFHNHDENPTLSIERDLELLEHLDRLNYHEAWIGEHHSGGFELIACPEMFIAAAAQRTRHIRLGTGVVSLPYHNPFMLADRMVQLDHMTRGRAMFGVGPGALVHDALKIGIDPGDQRQMMDESFDVIVRLLHGETVNKKTDWFNLTDAQLQLRPYTQPTMELAVAAARSPSGSRAGRQIRRRHAVDRRHRPSAMERHTAQLGPLRGDRARQRPYPRPQGLARRRLFPHRRDARAGAQERAVRGAGLRQLFPRRRDLPDHPARCRRPDRLADRDRHRLHRHARRCDRLYRAADEGLRRVRRAVRAGAELGRLGGDQAALRVDGALCPPAFPAEPRPAAGQLRLRDQPSRRFHRPGRRGDPEGDRSSTPRRAAAPAKRRAPAE